MKPYVQSSKHPNQSNGTFDITEVFRHRGSMDSLDFFQIHAVVRVPHDACVIQMRPIERIIQRFQSIQIPESLA
jgi:hypothetical protein